MEDPDGGNIIRRCLSVKQRQQEDEEIDAKSIVKEAARAGVDLSESNASYQGRFFNESVFFSGAAGTGKSFIVGVLKKMLNEMGMEDSMALTAPTGVAACNIGGVTIHSWAGIGIADKLWTRWSQQSWQAASKGRELYDNWKDTQMLVIDEISVFLAIW